MLARKKPIETLNAAELVPNIAPRLKLLQASEPPARKPGIKVGSVAELLAKLRSHEGIQL
jgi:electron transfer flavoprotein beta subunit